jgi:hypothetical protein
LRVGCAVIATIALVAAATLLSGESTVSTPSSCLICGDRGVADALLNVTLFAPFGAALAFARVRPWRIVLAGFALSVLVELLQLYIPGRDPSYGDLLFNTAGAGMGAAIPFLLSRWRLVARAQTGAWAAGWAAFACLVITGSALLLQPSLPRLIYYGQWTPEFGNSERYLGRVTSAKIGDLRVRNIAIRRSDELRTRLLAGDLLRIAVIAGPRPQWNSPVFNIYDDRRHEVLSITAQGSDLLLRYRMKASRLRLDQPSFLLRDALANVGASAPWSVDLRLIDGGICARTESASGCPLGFTVSRGWSVLLHTTFPRGVERLLDLLWLAALFLPAGTYINRPRTAILAGLVCVVGLMAANALAGLLPIGLVDVGAALCGMAAGAAIRWRVSQWRIREQHPSFPPTN